MKENYIRAHRIYNFRDIIFNAATRVPFAISWEKHPSWFNPDNIMTSTREQLERQVFTSRHHLNQPVPSEITNTLDYIGKDGQHADAFIDSASAFLSSILLLPPETIITIGCHPDGFCECCKTKTHCNDEEGIKAEIDHIQDILHKAKTLGIAQEIQVLESKSLDNHEEPEIPTKISLTADILYTLSSNI